MSRWAYFAYDMISFIIPAHNEEAWVGSCIVAIRSALNTVREDCEIIVADDASTDGTSSVARQAGARVIRVEHRHISATRNAGFRVAHGDVLFFIDADTLVSPAVIRSALCSIRGGAIGGGCVPRFDGILPLWWRAVYPIVVLGVRLLRHPGGSCLFCTRRAFETVGGFSELHYAAEDAVFVTALKCQGRFVVLADHVVTSGRNLRAHSFLSIGRLLVRLALRGPNGFRDRTGLDFWYRPRREKS